MRLLNAMNELATGTDKILHDPKEGFLAKKGMDAMASSDQALSDYDKTVNEIEGSLSNDWQKQEFRQRAKKERQAVNQTIQGHFAHEAEIYDKDQSFSYVQNLNNDAIANPFNAAARVAEQKKTLTEWAERNGYAADSEYTKKLTSEWASKTHYEVLSSIAASGDYGMTKNYYEANKNLIQGKYKSEVDKLMQETTTRSESQKITDAIMLKIQSGDIKTEEQAVAEAIKMSGDDPILRETATKEAGNSFNLHRRSVEETQKRYMDMADEQFTENNSVNDIDPGLWSKLTYQQQKSFRQAESQFLRGQNVPDGSDAYYKMRMKFTDPQERDRAINFDLREMRHLMSPSNYKELIDLQAGLLSKSAAAEAKLQGYRTQKQIVDGTIKSLNLNDKYTERFNRMVDERARAIETMTGKPVRTEDIQKIVDELILVQNKRTFLGVPYWEDKEFYEATDADSVPPDERVKIIGALMRNGMQTSPANILQLYRMVHPEK